MIAHNVLINFTISTEYCNNRSSKLYLSIPLHYKIEKSEPTLKPALIYQFPKFNLLIQKEFWYKSSKNATIAIDYLYKAVTFRVGWDTSDTFRFRLEYKF